MSSQAATSSSGSTNTGTLEFTPHPLYHTLVTRSCSTWNKQAGRYENPTRIYLVSPSTGDAPKMEDATKSGLLEMVEKGVYLVSRMRQTTLDNSLRDKETEAEGWAANMRGVYLDGKENLPHRHYTVQDVAELSRTLEGEPESQVSAFPSHSNVTEEEYERFVQQTNMWTSFIRYKAEFPDANASEFRAAWPEESDWEQNAVAEKSLLQVLTRCCGGLSLDLAREKAELDS